jgi:hypothetical protein
VGAYIERIPVQISMGTGREKRKKQKRRKKVERSEQEKKR